MGNFELEGESDLKVKKKLANQMLNECDGLRPICMLYNTKIEEMNSVKNKGMHNSNLLFELDLRLVCNILINFLIYNDADPSVRSDFTNLDLLIEETSLVAIKLSLDTAFVPVRKIILIFHIYLRYLFGKRKEDPKHKEFYSNLKYLKEMIDYRIFEKVPRFNLKS